MKSSDRRNNGKAMFFKRRKTSCTCSTVHLNIQNKATLVFADCRTWEVMQENTFVKMLSNSTSKKQKGKKKKV